MKVAVLDDIVGLGRAAVLDEFAGLGMFAGLEKVAGHFSFALTLYEYNPYLSDILILATFIVVLNILSPILLLALLWRAIFLLSHALIAIEYKLLAVFNTMSNILIPLLACSKNEFFFLP